MYLRKKVSTSRKDLFDIFPESFHKELEKNFSFYQRRIERIIEPKQEVTLETLKNHLHALPDDLISFALRKKYFDDLFDNTWLVFKFNLTPITINSVVNLFNTTDLKLEAVKCLPSIVPIFSNLFGAKENIDLNKAKRFISIFPETTHKKLIQNIVEVVSTKNILEAPIANEQPCYISKIEQSYSNGDTVYYTIFSNKGKEEIKINKQYKLKSIEASSQEELIKYILYLLTF